jgi:hypothetical protein
MPAKHVLQYVNNAQNIVKEIPRWNNAKNYAEPVQMLAASVQMNAILKTPRNALRPAVHVPKNAKNTTTKCAKNAQKNVESVRQNAERWRLKFLINRL